jgi:hypothetical protein
MTEMTYEHVAQLESRVQHNLGRRIWNLRLVARDNGIVLQGASAPTTRNNSPNMR